jgi:G:T-mismatch repair DNA endonuclease (very short patch repair protein)
MVFKKGHIHSLEIRQKISIAKKGKTSWCKGKILSEEHRRNISKGGVGKHNCSPEMRKHLSEVNKGQVPWMLGKKHSEESKRKCSESNIGKHNFSEESRKKISEHRLGMKFSEEHRRNISRVTKGRVSPNKGKKLSDAHKLKLSISGKGKHNFKMNDEGRRKLSLARLSRSFPVKDSKPERIVQGWLFDLGVEFVKHKVIMIRHRYQCDIFVPSKNLVIECDGDYWHGNLEHKNLSKYIYDTLPESVKNQMKNDKLRNKEMFDAGYKVLRLWEHEIKSMSIEEFKNKYEG